MNNNGKKKIRRGSPNSIRETDKVAVISHSNQSAVTALKTMLSLPKSPIEEVPSPNPTAEAVLALKSLLKSQSKLDLPQQPQVTESFQTLKAMLISTSKKEVDVNSMNIAEANGSPKQRLEKATPPRSRRKNKVSRHVEAPSSSSPSYYAGSLFQNSPDPLAMPLPDFDEFHSDFFSDDLNENKPRMEPTSPSVVPSTATQINTLRLLLKIPA